MAKTLTVHELVDFINSLDIIDNKISQDSINDELKTFHIDSMKFIELVIAIEKQFNIEFPDEYLNPRKVKCIKSLSEIINNTLNDTLN